MIGGNLHQEPPRDLASGSRSTVPRAISQSDLPCEQPVASCSLMEIGPERMVHGVFFILRRQGVASVIIFYRGKPPHRVPAALLGPWHYQFRMTIQRLGRR